MQFEIPVVLFLFKRIDTLEQIIERIRSVKPQKMYLIADGPRDANEKKQTDLCRKKAEELIDWNCKIIKFYSDVNIGVISNIGGGAKRVFDSEEVAIFIEDDNLPEKTFFRYCQEMLEKYKGEDKVLWVCGTNYLGKYKSEYSYMFTQHLLPCGWASWKYKFLNNYDMLLESIDDSKRLKNFKKSYKLKALYHQQLYSVERTKYLIETNMKHSSWDYQMLFSVRANQKYGISPCNNQIRNIGVDNVSIHGGNSWSNEMTRRLCGMDSYSLEFPLVHPPMVKIDDIYEDKISKVLLIPFRDRIKRKIASIVKPVLKMNKYDSMVELLNRKKSI